MRMQSITLKCARKRKANYVEDELMISRFGIAVEFKNEDDCPGLKTGGVLNVVRYITFRTGGAMMTALITEPKPTWLRLLPEYVPTGLMCTLIIRQA